MGKRERRRHHTWGRVAEDVAAWSLRLRGFRLLARRFRTPVGEVDLVVRRGQLLVFVEVKARADLTSALEAVSEDQLMRVARAAELFLLRHPEHGHCSLRFDLVAVRPWRLPHHVIDIWRA